MEEVTQETLLRVLDQLGTFEGRSQFTTWVHKIAVRIASDRAPPQTLARFIPRRTDRERGHPASQGPLADLAGRPRRLRRARRHAGTRPPRDRGGTDRPPAAGAGPARPAGYAHGGRRPQAARPTATLSTSSCTMPACGCARALRWRTSPRTKSWPCSSKSKIKRAINRPSSV
ncbi:MAG: hypothetical protein MZV70_17715 [Desulfobacterales bacterium]|nr:hypothetical protein [Desulfobacterales bacterium]